MKLLPKAAILLSLVAMPMLCACGGDDEPDAPAPVLPPAEGIAPVTYGGYTVITNNATHTDAVNSEMTYTATFNTSVTPYTMTLTMHNANFGSGMPVKLEIVIPDIPLQVAGAESFTFFVNSLTPLSGGVPQSAVPISNFGGSVAIGSSASLTFNFDIAVGFMRPTPGDFTVTATRLLPVAGN